MMCRCRILCRPLGIVEPQRRPAPGWNILDRPLLPFILKAWFGSTPAANPRSTRSALSFSISSGQPDHPSSAVPFASRRWNVSTARLPFFATRSSSCMWLGFPGGVSPRLGPADPADAVVQFSPSGSPSWGGRIGGTVSGLVARPCARHRKFAFGQHGNDIDRSWVDRNPTKAYRSHDRTFPLLQNL